MSPRLPGGALLALIVAAVAATAMAAVPATAAPVTHAGADGPPASLVQADKVRNSEWWLANLHVTQAWQSSRGAGITVALLSTGVLTSHPDLTGSVTTGPDYTGSGETSASSTWGIEGTSAASIIAGHGDNTGGASGIIGIAPAARILSIRVAFDAADALNGSATAVGRLPGAIAEGIQYAVRHGAKIIDLPLDPATLASDGAITGGLAAAAGGSAAERSAVSYALSQGAVLVAPAGDNGEDGNTASFPAFYPGVIALGAVDRHYTRAGFSTRQSYVTMTAPGVDVTAAARPAGYRAMSTTDAASAMVSGVAALIRSRYPELAAGQVRQALINGSTPRPASAAGTTGAGAGTVDALKAIQAAAMIAAPRPSARPSSPAATAPARGQPLTAPAKPGTVGLARSALRDAAAAAGALVVLLLGVLLGLRLWRRRAEQETRSSPEPRTLLGAPSGPPSGPLPIQVSSARHARAPGEEPAFAAAARPRRRAAGPGAAAEGPDLVSPRFAPPGGMPMEPGPLDHARHAEAGPAAPPAPATPPARGRIGNRGRAGHSGAGGRISAHGLRLRVTPVSRTATRSQVSAPGGPPWEPAAAPEGELLHEPRRLAPDPFTLSMRSAPATSAPWDATGPGPPPPGPGQPAPGQPAPGQPVPGQPALPPGGVHRPRWDPEWAGPGPALEPEAAPPGAVPP